MQKIVQLPPPNRGYRTYISEATGMSTVLSRWIISPL